MDPATTEHEHFPPLPGGMAPLWFGVIGAPAAWGTQLEAIYATAHWACMHNRRSLLQAITAALILVSLSCAAVSAAYRRGADRFADDRDRVHFLGSLGTLTGLLFALVIIAQGIASLMLNPSS